MIGRIVILFALLVLLLPIRAHAQVEPWRCEPRTAASPESSPQIATPVQPIPFPGEGGELTVFAAASLTDAFTAMADEITAANPEVEFTFNFAGSQALVTQLSEGGAEADVLALASPAQMALAVGAGVPVQEPTTFARNLLTVVVPADNPAGIASVADLARDGVRLVLANPDVPAGVYARQSLCNVASSITADEPGYLAAVAGNVVSEEENVRAVLTKVQLGEADAGVVYVSDAFSAGVEVASVGIPAEQNVVASYPIAALSDDPLAAAFIGHVLSPQGQATLASFGFEPKR